MEKHKLSFLVFAVALSFIGIIGFHPKSHNNSKAITSHETGFSLGKDTVDIGKLVDGNKELPITIYNNEDSSLIVKDVVSSCGCVLLNKKTFSIPSHDSATINAIIQPRTSDAKGSTIHRTIAFRTNYRDPIKFIVVKAAVS
jgi:Protein of unknown function (DUF1573)